VALQLVALRVTGVAIDDVEVSAGVQCAVTVGIVAVGFHQLVVSSDLDQTVAIIVGVIIRLAAAIRQTFNFTDNLPGGVVVQAVAITRLAAVLVIY
jgi:hypothetical protein